MSDPSFRNADGVPLTDVMVHALMNHLTSALGHSELLVMQAEGDAALAETAAEVRDACQRAVDLVASWRPRE
jgi:hypothetical protein